MWLAPKNRTAATPAQYNSHWSGLRLDNAPKPAQRIAEILSLTGCLDGLSVLDLGGGPTLSELVPRMREYTLVDFSSEACQEVVAAGGNAVCVDALKYLTDAPGLAKVDIVLCFGLVELLPPGALNTVFKLAPGNVLCFGTATAQAYLKYPDRMVCYTGREVALAAMSGGWRMVKKLPNKSHVWARYVKRGSL